MIERRLLNAGRHVGDAREAEHAHRHVTRNDHLGHRRHADGVAAERGHHSNLGRRLVRRTLHRTVHALLQSYVELLRLLTRHVAQRWRVGERHVAKPRPERLAVVADERIVAEHVDVIADQHEIARAERLIHATGSVRHNQRVRAELEHHAQRKDEIDHAMAFVKVKPTLLHYDIHAGQFANDQTILVSLNLQKK